MSLFVLFVCLFILFAALQMSKIIRHVLESISYVNILKPATTAEVYLHSECAVTEAM